jgi:Na+/proline symporter
MKTSAIFYGYCALFAIGWAITRSHYPQHLLAYCFVAFCVAWAVYRLPTMTGNETLKTFFLYERKMPRNEFIGTLVTTNVGFFSSVAFSTVLIVTMGIGPSVILVVAWAAGLMWFAKYIPNLLNFFRNGSTVHEYIADSYGKTPDEKRRLRFYSSVITFLLYLASVGAEIKFTSDVFSVPTGLSAGWLALALCIAGVIYVSISGYRGVVSTDRLRFWAILSGVFAIYLFVYHSAKAASLSFPPNYFTLQMVTVGPAPTALLSLVVLLALYQFCVMDMWERCIAIVNSDYIQKATDPDATAVTSMRHMIAWSIVPFVFLFGAWYGIGLLALGQNWCSDPNQIVPQLILRLQAFGASNLTGAFTETLIVLCFSAAALSTIDGFIIAAVQTVVFDWLPSFRKAHTEWDELDEKESGRTLTVARFLVLAVGGLAVTIAYMSFGIMSFWVGMYSLMLSFFPAIFLSLCSKEGSHQRSEFQVALSIVSGAAAALIVAVLGTFIFPNYPLLTALPPFLAVGIAFLVILPKPGDRQGVRMSIVILLATGALGYILATRPTHSEDSLDTSAPKPSVSSSAEHPSDVASSPR